MSTDGAQRYREEKKLKKEKEGYELLRIKKQYQKLLKEEGYDPTSINSHESDTTSSEKAPLNKTKNGGVQKKGVKPIAKKTTPFHKLEQKRAEEERIKKEQKEKESKEKEEKYKARVEYFKERKKTKNYVTRKTKKGQPILSNQIDVILNKLRK
ncbi:hypothetical protein HDU79_001539 [Rhizoclosmatium sp. JEL0117]|nr:hypothetical protein HDU79_001535 [Rhizoclosmatium sp. JEL0117]KAJ3292329.1 hypothetical protein HDU79_001539 [Rhizoclosmatium sp. JEL0117]